MIHARIDYDGKTYGISLQGHAGYAEHGKDIVCSAVSIIASTIGYIATDLFNNRKLKRKPTVRLEDGDAVVTIKPGKISCDYVSHVFTFAETALRLLSDNYPDNIALHINKQ